MFGTLSYDRDGQEPVFEADTTLPHSISRTEPSRHVTQIRKACELCRARKLRCSADPSGCDRCKASSHKCKYPPRSFRAGRKRPLTSRSSATAASDTSLSVDTATSIHNDNSGGGEFGQLEWQSASSSVGIDEDITSLSAHELLETSHSLGFQLSDVLPSSDYLLDNSTEYDFSDLFKVPWKDHQAVRTKTAKSLSKQPEVSPRSHKDPWRSNSTLRAPDSDSSQMFLEPLDLPEPATFVGYEWFEIPVNTISDLPSDSSISRSTSTEAIKGYERKNDMKAHSNGNHCQCLSLVASFIEQVETQRTKSDTSIESLLESCREPLGQSKALLACPRCRSRSEYILLLAMLAKSISAVCNDLVQRYVRDRLGGSHGQLALADKWPEVRVGTYFVEDSVERSTIVDALIVAKLNSLHDFLIDLKTGAKRRENSTLLLQIEDRVKVLKTLMLTSRRQVLGLNASFEV
ncbi:hypothetical protein EDB80DRAFT_691856 [Ilyonectria destructans]|nr:hypothetical protein EDB80DRAFT_691856 [Ilyonectria destructans]